MRAAKPWIGIALLAPMLVLAVSASSFVGVRCRMTGMVSVDRCCPDSERPSAPAQSTVDAAGCCERIIVETAKPVANTVGEQAVAAAPSLAPALAMMGTGDPQLAPRSWRFSLRRDGITVFRAPVRLLKRSLLI